MKITRRNLLAGAALVLVATGLAALATGAQADAGAWFPAAGSTVLSPGQVMDVGGTSLLSLTFNGIPNTQFNCTLPSGAIKVTTPNPVPSAAPGGTISLPVTMPAVLSSSDPSDPEYNQCTDTYTADPMDASTYGVAWTLNVTMPSGTSPSPYTGTLNTSLNLPQFALSYEMPVFWNCGLTGPTAAIPPAIVASYNTSMGKIVPAAGQSIGFRVAPRTPPSTCTIGATAAIAAELILDPAIDLVYVP